jgi:hypothetical protein
VSTSSFVAPTLHLLTEIMKVTVRNTKTKVLLTIECKNMKHPQAQRTRFDQTLASNSWMLQENKKPEVHGDGTVTTVSVWGRTFGHRKTKNEIEKITGNLLSRAVKYAELDAYYSEFLHERVPEDAEVFKLAPVLFSDD